MAKQKADKKKQAPGKVVEATHQPTATNEDKYDSVPYESYVYSQTQPEHLCMIATLFNLKPAKLEKARVLEIGCAGGGNLFPFALANPKAQCLGIDLSGEQIKQANAQKKELDLRNIEFRQADISKLTKKDLGEYDYIICHGVYSWVPKKVREAIFDVCRDHLSDNGLAVISYNTLPGWGAVKTLRDMMLYHTGGFKDPKRQVHEAKALLGFLNENAPEANESYRQVIERELKILNNTNDSYLFHEHLELENNQFYLHEFVADAEKHGLGYVGDSALNTMYIGNFNRKVQQTLAQLGDVVRQEQYIDFLINRRFRHSILTKTANAEKIQRNIRPESIFDFYVHALFTAPESKDIKTGVAAFTKKGTKESFNANDDLTTKLFIKLAQMSEKPVKLDDVIKVVVKEEKLKDDKFLRQTFSNSGLMLVLQGFLSLHCATVEYETEISKKPRAGQLVRQQAQQSESSRVTSFWKQSVNIDPFTRKLLTLLDGRHDVPALVKKLKEAVRAGELHVNRDGKPVTDDKDLEKILADHTQTTLPKLAKLALLEA